jgi:hypothetical protein
VFEPRRFFYVFSHLGRLSYALFHDEAPRPSHVIGAVVFRQELTGRWCAASLDELKAEYLLRREYGTLPPDNMVTPPAKKADGRLLDSVEHNGMPEAAP